MILEQYLQEFPKKYQCFGRKIEPQTANFLIHGTIGSGKTTLLHKFLWDNSKPSKGLYIDFNDWRNSNLTFNSVIEFAKQKELTHLALDNVSQDLRVIDGISIAAASKYAHNIKGFETINLELLDFEEFIAFENNTARIDSENALASSFAKFTHIGNMPEKLYISDAKRADITQKLLKSVLSSNIKQEIIKTLAIHQAHNISYLQIYNYLKQRVKISKDLLYEEIDELLNIKLIKVVEKFDTQKSPKKLYFADFAMPNAISNYRDFGRLFENALYLEIQNKKPYYTDNLSFYFPNEEKAIIARVFDSKDIIKQRTKTLLNKSKNLKIKTLDVITMHTSFDFKINDIDIFVKPFWNFAIEQN